MSECRAGSCPGKEHFSLARVVDAKGNWQVVSEKLRRKQRNVKIDFSEVRIINDCAQGDTTAEFRILVMRG